MFLSPFITLSSILLTVLSNFISSAEKENFQHHIILPILQQQALRQYQQNAINKAFAPASAQAPHPPPQRSPGSSQREKLSWSSYKGNLPSSNSRSYVPKKFKRQGGFGDDDAPDIESSEAQKSKANKAKAQGGRSIVGEPEPEAEEQLVPAKAGAGPETGAHSEDKHQHFDYDASGEMEELIEMPLTHRSWDEYRESKKLMRLQKTKSCPNCNSAVYTPVVDPDQHFHNIDKLFKTKNERTKAVHDLNIFMRKQGKKSRFLSKALKDFAGRKNCPDGKPPPCA